MRSEAEKQEEKFYNYDYETADDSSAEAVIQKELEEQDGHDIKYRSCSWQKTAGLLFSEYICLAILSFPWSYSVLGLIPGLILTVFVSLTTLYTGLIIGDYCARYPKLQNVCDIGQHLFWNNRWFYWLTAIAFILNNTLIAGLHCLVGAKYLNTVSNHGACTVAFSAITGVICLMFSLPRTFAHMSWIGIFAAATQFVAVLLCIIFSATQNHPEGFDPETLVKWHLWPVAGTTYTQGMSAFLNIVYTFVGQICYPSFIAEMKRPRDFKYAVISVTFAQVVVFSLAGAIIYVNIGNDYITAPSFGSIAGNNKIIAFSFAIPTIIFLGSLYSNVTSQWVFFHVFDEKSRHRYSHTAKGWGVWVGVNVATWILAFVVAEVIPFFSDLLSLMSSLFDCWFGFVFWGVAYIRLKQDKYRGQFNNFGEFWPRLTVKEKIEYLVNIILIIIGFYIFGPGTYASVNSIVLSYKSGIYGSAFSCANNGF